MPALKTIAILAFALTTAGFGASAGPFATLSGDAPLVIGHRGASGYLPEHTLESYKRAIALGADFVEPDLVATRDGVLIARHEPILDGTTDVAIKFDVSRKSTRLLDGVSTTAYFTTDFTLTEIKTLRAVQPVASRDQSFNGQFEIPTFQEIIDLVKSESARLGKTIGLYPETKHPSFHNALSLGLDDALVAALTVNGLTAPGSKVFIQSFEVANLQYLRTQLPNAQLVQLIDANDVNPDGTIDLTPPYDKPYDFAVANDPRSFPDLLTDVGLAFIKTYANGIGPWKPYVVSWRAVDANGDGLPDDLNGDGLIDQRDKVLLPASDLVDRAHLAGLLVHPYTFRNEPGRLAADYAGDPLAEYLQFIALGVDGFFSDFPDTPRAAIDSVVPAPASLALLLGALLPLVRRRYVGSCMPGVSHSA